jgi:soluble lytic murein transglycosylase
VAVAAAWFSLSAAAVDPLAELKAGQAALEAKQYALAVKTIEPLSKRLPKLADYCAWMLASAEIGLKNYDRAPKRLDAVWKQSPPSPLTAKSYLLMAEAYRLGGSYQEALDVLRKNYATLPQPKGDLALALTFGAAGDSVSAAAYFQRVYYGFPSAFEAIQADSELSRLKTLLGENYPPPAPGAPLGRAIKLLESGQIQRARKELEALIPQLGGADRDRARVRIGVADYDAKRNAPALAYLKSLEGLSPEADAERLYYVLMDARRLDRADEASAALNRLGSLYPESTWRLKALVAAANQYLIENKPESYESLFRACYESFPKEAEAPECHWKVAWQHYLQRQSDAGDLLRAQLRMFPASEESSAALYFLGRLAEGAHDGSSALAYYGEVVREYPNHYYATQARDRLARLGMGAPSPAAAEFLRSVSFPPRMHIDSFQPGANVMARIERAKMLASAGLEDWSRDELRFGAEVDGQPQLMAIELATLYGPSRPDQALRYMKHYAGDYLYLPIESAPLQFWTLAFPLPYRADLERFSKKNGLDVFLVAALIRQESEFDPKVVSYANARGLTQILPSTGRELSRRLKLQPYSVAKLFQPSYNLQLGTYYLQSLTEQTGGRIEAALAAYNAGLSRARSWLGWGDFQEPAEFIETVPFYQTRSYIQTVLRNADMYRRVYGMTERASK